MPIFPKCLYSNKCLYSKKEGNLLTRVAFRICFLSNFFDSVYFIIREILFIRKDVIDDMSIFLFALQIYTFNL